MFIYYIRLIDQIIKEVNMSDYSRKTLEQIPSFEQMRSLLSPAITQIVQNYAPPMTRTYSDFGAL